MLLIIQTIFAILLITAVIVFAVMGFKQGRRSRIMATLAHAEKMRFSYSDPFNIPRSCSDLEIMQMGHNPRASNVIYGNRDAIGVRGFDYSYEIGHGPRRMTRKFYVVLIHSITDAIADVLLFDASSLDANFVFPETNNDKIGNWCYTGSKTLAKALVSASSDIKPSLVRIESRGDWLMLATDGNHPPAAVITLIDQSITLARGVGDLVKSRELKVDI